MRFDPEIFDAARQEFLAHLRYAKGHRATTCYAYHADLGQWRDWLQQAGKDWQRARAADVEQFAAWQLRDRGISPAIVCCRLWPGVSRACCDAAILSVGSVGMSSACIWRSCLHMSSPVRFAAASIMRL